MKVKLEPIRHLRRELKACCLCGDFVLHGAVRGPGAELVFRAQVVDGVVWVPLKGHGGANCPDPGPETARFWHRPIKREAYKRARRESAIARRTAH